MFGYTREDIILAGRISFILLCIFLFFFNLFFAFFGTIQWLSALGACLMVFQVTVSSKALIEYIHKHNR